MTSISTTDRRLASVTSPSTDRPGERPLLHCSSRPVLRFTRYAVISALIGIGVVLLLSLDDPELLDHMELLGGVVMGLCIGSGSIIMELILLRPLLALRVRPVLLARCVSYFLGGAVGHWLGILLSYGLLGVDDWAQEVHPVWSMLLYGVLAVSVGLTFHTVESLRSSLAAKVAELKEREYADKELETARLIQKRLMPPESASGPGFSLAATNRAASFVAGDFYDYFHLPDGTMGFAVADVAGKGIGASLQMATVKAMLPLVAAQRLSTDNPVAGTLDDLNERLFGELGPREFVALLYGRFDPDRYEVEFANAGLPDPYWISDDSSCQPRVVPMTVEGERLPLGVRPGTRYRSRHAAAGEAGTFLLLTDGLVERMVGTEPLGYDRFEEELQRMQPDDDPGLWLDRLQERLGRLSEGEPEDDDCTVMAIRCSLEAAGTPALGKGDVERATA